MQKAVQEQTSLRLKATTKSVSIDGEDYSPVDWNRSLGAKDETIVGIPAGTFALGFVIEKARDAFRARPGDDRVKVRGGPLVVGLHGGLAPALGSN